MQPQLSAFLEDHVQEHLHEHVARVAHVPVSRCHKVMQPVIARARPSPRWRHCIKYLNSNLSQPSRASLIKLKQPRKAYIGRAAFVRLGEHEGRPVPYCPEGRVPGATGSGKSGCDVGREICHPRLRFERERVCIEQ